METTRKRKDRGIGNDSGQEANMKYKSGKAGLAGVFMMVFAATAAGCGAEEPCNNAVQDGDETGVDCGGSCVVQGRKCQTGFLGQHGRNCNIPEDCFSGACQSGQCVDAQCADGKVNGNETDVDCGGDVCALCLNGKACGTANANCTSGLCFNGRCTECTQDAQCATGFICRNAHCVKNDRPSTCWDRVKNGDESDADCGGDVCPRCAKGSTCGSSKDCADGLACTNGLCQEPTQPPSPTCVDGVKNGQETDVDCGDGCPKCADGKACLANADCTSDFCSGGKCAPKPAPPPTCMDGIKNGAETDLDCGGVDCPKCADGRACKANTDCSSDFCSNGKCEAKQPPLPTCMDGVKNGQETGVDCGGPCPPCQRPPPPPNCMDKIKNGDETAIDCGGRQCPACQASFTCKVDLDCQTGKCLNNGTCAAACEDGKQDGNESDVDCGGSCAKCVDGAKCNGGNDCQSGFCALNSTCQPKPAPPPAPTCVDGVKNGAETDLDCGGTCPKCGDGKVCLANTDCSSGNCSSGKCEPVPPPVAQRILLKSSAQALIDCGGSIQLYAFDGGGAAHPPIGQGGSTVDITNQKPWSGSVQFGRVCNGSWDFRWDAIQAGSKLEQYFEAASVSGQDRLGGLRNCKWFGGVGNRPTLNVDANAPPC